MKVQLASSQCVKVRVREYEDADVIALVNAGKVTELTTAINADRRQKVALVDFRADLSDKIETGGFKRKVTSVMKDGKPEEVYDETEGDHIGRFVDALQAGQYTVDGFVLPSGDDKVKEQAAYGYLQKMAFTCGDKLDEEGNPCYELDVNRPVRTGGAGLVPKWAMDAANAIINNKSEQKWIGNFTSGYTSASGVVIDPIPFDSFIQTPAQGATPEQAQEVRERNQKNLAKAIVAVRKQEETKRAPEFI